MSQPREAAPRDAPAAGQATPDPALERIQRDRQPGLHIRRPGVRLARPTPPRLFKQLPIGRLEIKRECKPIDRVAVGPRHFLLQFLYTVDTHPSAVCERFLGQPGGQPMRAEEFAKRSRGQQASRWPGLALLEQGE